MGQRDRLMRSALELAGRGMCVFPLRPGGKTPALGQWEARATTEVEQIERWWVAAPYNIGVATGPSDLLVVDLDAPKAGSGSPVRQHGRQVLHRLARRRGEHIPSRTYSVATAGRGLHLYFRAPVEPLGNSAGRIGPCIDTRGTGGYVVGSGSAIEGRRYRVVRDGEVIDAPRWIVEALRATRRASVPHPPTVVHRGAYVAAAVEGEVRNVAQAAVGRRNHVLFVAAARLARFVGSGQLTACEIHAVLESAAARHVGTDGFTSAEARRTVGSGLRRGADPPLRRMDRGTAGPVLRRETADAHGAGHPGGRGQGRTSGHRWT
jgi:hypothetical protein